MIKDRLLDFINSRGISQREFALRIGVSTSYISNIVKSIGSDVLAKIMEEYPELNIGWLISGKGSMLYSDYANGIPSEDDRFVIINKEAWEQIKAKTEQTEKLIEGLLSNK